jgi:hypothetical protein
MLHRAKGGDPGASDQGNNSFNQVTSVSNKIACEAFLFLELSSG